jgi:tRNA(Ile)-lysidine synthase
MTTSPTLAVAVSGGRDSTALLHAVARQARDAGLRVVALHVHHGLNPAADDWVDHVRRQCRRWRLDCRVARLMGTLAAGQSVEAWARAGRYRELARLAREEGASHVLLAHHRRDQAETVLLQALRGAGAAGLSAMPEVISRNGLFWCRPWLQQPASAIEAYVQRWRLSHIEDGSNSDTRFDRNRLRHEVWPALLAAFPHAETSLLAVAQQAQATAQLWAEVGQQVLDGLGAAEELPVPAWLALPPATRRASLQLWLRRQLGQGAPEALLQRLLTALPDQRSARVPVGAGRELRLYRGVLRLHADAGVAAELPLPTASPEEPRWRQPGLHALPAWGGSLRVTPVLRDGIALVCLDQAEMRPRGGGEQWQHRPASQPRSLKKQYQMLAVPAWARTGPLIWSGGRLLFVPGLGLDARVLAAEGEPQVQLAWVPERSV